MDPNQPIPSEQQQELSRLHELSEQATLAGIDVSQFKGNRAALFAALNAKVAEAVTSHPLSFDELVSERRHQAAQGLNSSRPKAGV